MISPPDIRGTPRARARLRGLGALLALAALLAGVPLLLASVTGLPVPGRLPSPADLARVLSRPADDGFLLGVLRVAAWLLWAAFTVSTLLETLGHVRGRRAWRLPGLGGFHQFTGKLIAAVMLMNTPAVASTATEARPVAATAPLDGSGRHVGVHEGREPFGIGPRSPGHAGPQRHSAPVVSQAMVFATGMLAGGVLVRLAQLRARQRQHRRDGRRIRLPEQPRTHHTEHRLAYQADPSTTRRVRAALHALLTGLAAAEITPPAIVGVHLIDQRLELLLAEPAATAPPPFTVVDGSQNMCWQLPRLAALDEPGVLPVPGPGLEGGNADQTAIADPLAGLITAGQTELGGHLLLNAGLLGMIGCAGPAPWVERLLTTIAVEAATDPYQRGYQAILVGFPELSNIPGRNRACSNLAEAITLLQDSAHTRPGRPFTLVISRHPASTGQAAQLGQALHRTPHLTAAVLSATGNGPDLPACLAFLDDHAAAGPQLHIKPLGLTVRPCPLAGDDYADIAELLTTAADLQDVSPDTPPYPQNPPAGDREPDRPPRASTRHSPAKNAAPPRSQKVDVAVLGPLEISGTTCKLQPKQAEIVVLLALHSPAGMRAEQLRTFLGPDPDHPRTPDSLRQALTRTRRALGEAADGTSRIHHAGDSTYRLHQVRLDWEEFQHLTGQAAAEPGPARSEHLAQALQLVRGEPFQGCYYWWLPTAVLETMRAAIIDTAWRLAEQRLAERDAVGAAAAARTGLLCEPAAEQLWRIIMRAQHSTGNTAGVHEAWTHCLRELAAIDPGLTPHPDTTAVYRQATELAR
jgi:DNA-binding SARP family transcriptional activator